VTCPRQLQLAGRPLGSLPSMKTTSEAWQPFTRPFILQLQDRLNLSCHASYIDDDVHALGGPLRLLVDLEAVSRIRSQPSSCLKALSPTITFGACAKPKS